MKADIRKKRGKLSIKWKVFMYLLLFTGIIILLLWLFQVVLLDHIYKTVKMNEIKDGAHAINSSINDKDLSYTVDDVAAKDICVSVINVDDGKVPLFHNHCLSNCVIHNIDRQGMQTLYDATVKNGNSNTQRFMYDAAHGKYIGIEGDFFDDSQLDQYKGQLPESIIYSIITTNSEGDDIFILLNSEISPVSATVGTLNRILGVISMVLVLLALVLAMIISMRVTGPIRSLTSSARELAKGNYDIRFERGGYSEISELADTLSYAKHELRRVDELRKELIANVSHDLRTPLTMIGGYSEIMRDIPGENTPENVQVIIDETNRLSTLVNDLLDISKLQSGAIPMEYSCFDLSHTLRNTLDRFSHFCKKDGYVIDLYCEEGIYVVADEKRMTQVIYNLVSNALTHTGDSRQIYVRLFKKDNCVRFEVEDFGEGIDPENLPMIWDRYYKVDKVHKRAAVGTGLGLSIVKTIMEQHNGRYGVASAVGEGSLFFVELPDPERNKDE